VEIDTRGGFSFIWDHTPMIVKEQQTNAINGILDCVMIENLDNEVCKQFAMNGNTSTNFNSW
jgi:hypothetical protein